MENASALLLEHANQDRKAGRAEIALNEEKAADQWQARANTLPPVTGHLKSGQRSSIQSQPF
jgi:hypothetical protein